MLGFRRSAYFVFFVHFIATTLSAPQQGVTDYERFSECGRTVDNIFDDGPVDGEFPYFCSLFVKKQGQNLFIGGATLVSENVLMSLATLFSNLKLIGEKGDCNTFTLKHDVFASCGNVNLKSLEPSTRQDQPIQKVYILPEHSNSSLINDYALLITKPFKYTNEVGRVCLPLKDVEEEEVFDFNSCITLGHGSDEYDIYADELKKANMNLVSRQDCEDKLNQGHFKNSGIDDWKLDASHICAGDGKEDTCKGDGGGPLLCKYRFSFQEAPDSDYSSYIQVGVTAWGAKSCNYKENTLPSVYSRVSRVISWINKIIGCNPVENISDIADIRNFDLRTLDSQDCTCP